MSVSVGLFYVRDLWLFTAHDGFIMVGNILTKIWFSTARTQDDFWRHKKKERKKKVVYNKEDMVSFPPQLFTFSTTVLTVLEKDAAQAKT